MLREIKRGSEEFEKMVRPAIRRRHESFPNGSSYWEEYLGEDIFPGKPLNIERRSEGDGSDLGVHFCTRDQVISAIIVWD